MAACLVVFAALTGANAMADSKVSNVRAAQRVGTKYVDIRYDLLDDGIGTTPPATVALVISDDDGKTFKVPAKEVGGEGFGAGQVAGIDKHITWNAGVDWNNKVSPNMRFKVTTVPLGEDFVIIPAGSFQMGDATGVGGVEHGDELPVHSVQVSAFYLGKYEVTKELWDAVRAWGEINGYTDLPVGSTYGTTNYGKGPTHPVNYVNWYAIVKWCNARSQKEGLTPCYTVAGSVYNIEESDPDCNWSANGYRLPTEAEWEKAARGGLNGQNFPWGNTITHSQANYYSSSSSSYDTSSTRGYHPTYQNGVQPYTSPVGSFAANGYRLYDMTGNVAEWCWDRYSGSYYGSSPGIDPRGGSGSDRVLRGGSWKHYAIGCRVAVRYGNGYDPSFGSSGSIGFRLARSSVP